MTNDEISEIDRRLQEAYGREQIDTAAVAAAVLGEIRHRNRPHPVLWRAAAAAVLTVAASAYWTHRRTPEPAIFSAAARDHRAEVVQNAPRHWRTTDTDIDLLAARFGLNRERIGFSGYRLLRARICLLDGRRVLHLVYDDLHNGDNAEYSLYLVPGGAAVPAVEVRDGAQYISGFHGDRIDGLVVGEGTAPDCLRFAKTATGS
jgi:hypothetical protein